VVLPGSSTLLLAVSWLRVSKCRQAAAVAAMGKPSSRTRPSLSGGSNARLWPLPAMLITTTTTTTITIATTATRAMIDALGLVR
jgi:hypothetical protein